MAVRESMGQKMLGAFDNDSEESELSEYFNANKTKAKQPPLIKLKKTEVPISGRATSTSEMAASVKFGRTLMKLYDIITSCEM